MRAGRRGAMHTAGQWPVDLRGPVHRPPPAPLSLNSPQQLHLLGVYADGWLSAVEVISGLPLRALSSTGVIGGAIAPCVLVAQVALRCDQ